MENTEAVVRGRNLVLTWSYRLPAKLYDLENFATRVHHLEERRSSDL